MNHFIFTYKDCKLCSDTTEYGENQVKKKTLPPSPQTEYLENSNNIFLPPFPNILSYHPAYYKE